MFFPPSVVSWPGLRKLLTWLSFLNMHIRKLGFGRQRTSSLGMRSDWRVVKLRRVGLPPTKRLRSFHVKRSLSNVISDIA